jgi:hypothetical protein
MQRKTNNQRLNTTSLKKISYEEGKLFITSLAIMGLHGNPISTKNSLSN